MKKFIWQQTTVAKRLAGVWLLVGLVSTGCQTSREPIPFTDVPDDTPYATPSKSAAPGNETAAGEAARLAVGDLVKVTFSGIQTPPLPHEEQVKEDGNITLPMIGPVKAEGKTLGELQKAIYSKYVPLFYKQLTVTTSSERRIFYVQGQVRNPGRQEYLGQTTVLKAIAGAQDFTDFADRKRVVLTRADGSRTIVDCKKAAEDSTYDLPVYPGDKIEVPMRGPGGIFGL
ncbi:MAG TPA: polysaccharide biosynthesis/export family protein [Verrucomicrobiota bacterium]|nr:polysaccharide biosynthesis/export family protein [Verrucomicrobiota bacterium]HNT13731.1 polysaccharide biosynthesis/export family protein [Verrucomicrobiota bacterium]